MDAILTRLFLIIFSLIFIKYDMLIFIPFLLGVYFIFDRSKWNFLVLGIYFFVFLLLSSDVVFLFVTTGVLLLIIIVFNVLFKAKKAEPDSGDIDFSKLFGGM